MDVMAIIEQYYPKDSPGWQVLVTHSRMVRDYALTIVSKHPALNADAKFVEEAALLHDIGIFKTHAPNLHCFGEMPYICHGYLGRELLEANGLPRHALVCERHTGTGLTVAEIRDQQLPIPVRDMRPVSIEEQIICFADKFYSKSGDLTQMKSVDKVRRSMQRFDERQAQQFDEWCQQFL